MRLLRAALAGLGMALPATAMAAGMPQLDFANPLTTSQVVWGVIIFGVLYVLASRFALPRVATVLEERANHIAHDLTTAQRAKTQADLAVAEVVESTAKARAESQAAINAALDEAKAEAAKMAVTMNQRLEKQLAEAETRIAAARAAAMGALRQVATETAGTIVARLTGAQPEPARLQGAVGAVLGARGLG